MSVTSCGFGKRIEVFGDSFIKPQEVTLTGTVFQFDEPRNSEIRYDLTWPVDVVTRSFDGSVSVRMLSNRRKQISVSHLL